MRLALISVVKFVDWREYFKFFILFLMDLIFYYGISKSHSRHQPKNLLIFVEIFVALFDTWNGIINFFFKLDMFFIKKEVFFILL